MTKGAMNFDVAVLEEESGEGGEVGDMCNQELREPGTLRVMVLTCE